MKTILLIVCLIAAAAIAWQSIFFGIRFSHSKKLVEKAVPFSVDRGSTAPRILIVGDSLGVGVGASSPENSMAGLIASEYSSVSIVNQSVSGATLADAYEQLSRAEGDFDLIYIHAGANDVIAFTDLAMVQKNAEALFTAAKEKSKNVIIMQSGSVGFAPIFFQPLDSIYTWRTKRAHTIVKDEAQKAGVVYADLYRERNEDPFLKDPKRYFAEDGLHLTDAGYAAWFSVWKKAVDEQGWFER